MQEIEGITQKNSKRFGTNKKYPVASDCDLNNNCDIHDESDEYPIKFNGHVSLNVA